MNNIRLDNETKRYINAFVQNFGKVRIERITYDKGYYIYYPDTAADYIQYCYNKDYLKGWLYGAIQCKNIFPIYEKIAEKKAEG